MKFYYRIIGRWSDHHIKDANKFGVKLYPGYNKIDILEFGNFSKMIELLSTAEDFKYYKTIPSFEVLEYENASSYLLRGGFKSKTFNVCNINKCENCSTSFLGREDYIEIDSLPKISKNDLLFTSKEFNNFLFTTEGFYRKYLKQFGIKSRKTKFKSKITDDIVFIDIPESRYELLINEIEYPYLFDPQNENAICNFCNKKIYSNQILGYFPQYAGNNKLHMSYTQEVFGWYNHIIISKSLAQILVDHGVIKWDSFHLIPVSNNGQFECV